MRLGKIGKDKVIAPSPLGNQKMILFHGLGNVVRIQSKTKNLIPIGNKTKTKSDAKSNSNISIYGTDSSLNFFSNGAFQNQPIFATESVRLKTKCL